MAVRPFCRPCYEMVEAASRPRRERDRFVDGMLNPEYLPDYDEENQAVTEPGVNLLYDPGFEGGVGW